MGGTFIAHALLSPRVTEATGGGDKIFDSGGVDFLDFHAGCCTAAAAADQRKCNPLSPKGGYCNNSLKSRRDFLLVGGPLLGAMIIETEEKSGVPVIGKVAI